MGDAADAPVTVGRPLAAPTSGARSVTRSRRSSLLSSVSAVSPRHSTESASDFLRASSSAIFSSMVPSVMKRCTCTGLVWPIR